MTDLPAVPAAPDSLMSFGQTQLRPQDLVIPRVKVAQAISREVADKQAEAGDFVNTLTGESYGPTLDILPILPFMQRVLLVRKERRDAIEDALGEKIGEQDGLLCRSFDMIHGIGVPGLLCETECPLSQWRTDDGVNKPPLCTETYNVAAATTIGELVVIGMSKSGAKTGKRLFSVIRMSSPGAAPWTRIISLKTRAERNDQGNFFVPDFQVSKERPDDGQIRDALSWARQLRGVQIDVTPDDEGEEGGAIGNDDPNRPF